jgi:integrase
MTLTARGVATISEPGYHPDGTVKGLYLQVTSNKSGEINRSWIFRYTSPINKKRREMGLGSTFDRSLKDARIEAARCRNQILEGLDPLDEKQKELERRNSINAIPTFQAAAIDFIKAKKSEWTNQKHADQWTSTLKTYAFPIIGDKRVSDITIDQITKLLLANNLWEEKTETAQRVQQRIAAVLDACRARKLLKGENPAQWKNNLDKIMPSPKKIKHEKHHEALPYKKIYEFFEFTSTKNSVSARALEFIILTAVRSSEATEARWHEIDLKEKTWTIPAGRMKAKKSHTVPLSKQALEILGDMEKCKVSDYVFSSPYKDGNKGISGTAMSKVFKSDPRYSMLTIHGFRSTFRDWASEESNHSNETAEMALAHAIKNKSERAYRRMDQLEKRRELMQDWATFIFTRSIKNNRGPTLDAFIDR